MMDKEILFILGRLEGKVDSLLSQQVVHNKALQKHEKRLRDLEISRGWLLGAAAALSVVISLATKFMGDL